VCHHCAQRDVNEECTYDALPNRRGPDRLQGARTRGTRPQEDGEPRRRRRRSATVEQAAGGGSFGIRRPSVNAKPSTLDTFGETTSLVHPQQNGVRSNTPTPNKFEEFLESIVQLSSITAPNQLLALESASNGHLVSDLVSS
jgi:hypothetical protein